MREASGFIEYAPLGVVGVITPWNGPVWLSTVGLLSSLLAGNAVLYKPSENSLRTGIALARRFQSLADCPQGLVQLVAGGKSHGQAVVKSGVAMISLVGSTKAGKDIMKTCAAHLKRVSLELGGLDSAIVLKDADIPATARKIVRINCANSGQVCCSIKRVYVEREVYSEFLKEAVAESLRFVSAIRWKRSIWALWPDRSSCGKSKPRWLTLFRRRPDPDGRLAAGSQRILLSPDHHRRRDSRYEPDEQ